MLEKIKQYHEYKRLAEEAQAIADELKAAMTERGESKLIVGEYKVSYSDCTRKDLDKKRLEADLSDLSEYTKITSYKRFAVV
ncbi:MAG: hypothetical protein LBQ15_07755 [Clostridium sp.]|nr:hypothetical protein [Clostridium sp.]